MHTIGLLYEVITQQNLQKHRNFFVQNIIFQFRFPFKLSRVLIVLCSPALGVA